MSRQKETLQERLQARIDKHRDPRGNICLGTYNHWDSALDLEAIGSLDAAQAEIARLKAIVRVNGLRWGHTHADIDALIGADPSASDDFRQPEAAPEGLIRNAALQEAAAHLRDMGYWTQASAVLSLCTNASAPTPASAVASEAEVVSAQGTTVASLLEMIERYTDAIQGKSELVVGLLNCNFVMLEAADIIRQLLSRPSSRAAGLEEAAKHLEDIAASLTTNDDGPEAFSNNITATRFRRAAVIIRALASTPAPASAQDLVKALKMPMVYQIEGDEEHVYLGIGKVTVFVTKAAGPEGIALLKFAAEQRAALSATGGAK